MQERKARAQERARARWTRAIRWACAHVRERREKERKAREEAERREAAADDGKRKSARLKAIPEKNYREARTWQRREGETRKQAVTAARGTRVGIRLRKWMDGADGWDASGPMSVVGGWRRRDPG